MRMIYLSCKPSILMVYLYDMFCLSFAKSENVENFQ